VATPPTRVSYNTPTVGFGSSATPKTTPAFDVQAGDLLVFIGSGEDSPATIGTPSASGGSVTWTSRQSIVVTNYCTMYLWTGDVGATATGITVSASGVSSRTWSFGVTVWRNHGGVGVSGKANVASGGPSLALTTSANSAVQCGSDDWNAGDGASRTWRTVNGSAMTESLYFRNSLTYTVYAGYAPDTGAAGTTTVGLSVPSTQKYSIVGVEILAAAGGGSSFSGSASLSGSGTLTNAGTPAPAASRSLSGSGTVTGAGSPAIPGSESATGSGSLTFGGKPGFSGPLSGSGSGTLTLTGAAVYVGSAALSGAGTVTLGGTPKAINSTAPSGAGTLALGGSPAATGTGPLTGSGTLTLSGTPGGGGGPESHSGLVMLTGDGGLSAAGAPAPTGTLSLGGAGFITLSAAGRTMYTFDPPGKQLPMDPTGRDFLWSKVKFFRGDAVVRYTTGAFKQVTTHDPDETGIDKVYLGGHTYTIDDGTAAELIQAGYGPYLKVVTS
jgi:hypothetical protein